MTLRIAIDARLDSGVLGGVQQTIIGLAAGLSELEEGAETYSFLAYRDATEWLGTVRGRSCRFLFVDRPAPLRRSGWRSLVAPALRAPVVRRAVERGPLGHLVQVGVPESDGTVEREGMHVMHFTMQLGFRTAVPSIYVPHDLQHLHLPQFFSPFERKWRDAAYGTHAAAAKGQPRTTRVRKRCGRGRSRRSSGPCEHAARDALAGKPSGALCGVPQGPVVAADGRRRASCWVQAMGDECRAHGRAAVGPLVSAPFLAPAAHASGMIGRRARGATPFRSGTSPQRAQPNAVPISAVIFTTEEAILRLRKDLHYQDLVRDSYLGPDVRENAERFLESGKFAAVLWRLGDRVGASVLDVGAGTGIASYAFARSGPREVSALETDPSEVVGQGTVRRISQGLAIESATGAGESLPFPDGRFDIVYARQVLHHASDLHALLKECARVLVPGRLIVPTREHVIDDAARLEVFLDGHPVHRLVGGEGAHPVDAYVAAFQRAGPALEKVLGPYDSVVNALPACRGEESLAPHLRRLLESRLGAISWLVARIPVVEHAIRRRMDRPLPGRMYSLVGTKR
jgi:2-polyprenyl-3-methyl-5-hydroxy-6-metoxy-1,4-benzoquinol methylase